MRRLFAFIALAIATLTVAITSVPGIITSMNQGIEFKGGFEILYQVMDQDGIEIADAEKADAVAAAAEVVSNRIDIAGVKNPQISIEGEDMIRVTIASKNEQETADVRELLTSDTEITFRDVNDKLLASASDLLEDNGALLDYQDGKPVVSLKIKDTDLWTKITTDISGRSNGENMIVIWLGYDESYDELNEYGFAGDSYKYAFSPDANGNYNIQAANKIISNATVSQVFYDDVVITGSFTDELAQKMANLIKAGTIDFQLKEISVSSVGAAYGSNAFNQSLIAGLIGLLLVCVLMIGAFGVAGVASAISLVLYIVLCLAGFNILEGEYGPDTIAATVIGIGMAVDANILTFERIRDELHKGKSLRNSFVEGSKKSFSSILDGEITTLIAALALYLFGTRTVKGFATMLVISIFFTVIIMVLVTKGLLSLLCQSEFFANRKTWFGIKKENIPDVSKGEEQKYFGKFKNIKFTKYGKLVSIVNGSFIALGLIFMLAFKIFGGAGLNLGLNFSEGTKIYFVTADPSYSTVEQVTEFFETQEGIEVVPTQVVVGFDEEEISTAIASMYADELAAINATVEDNTLKLYTVSVSFKYQLDSDKMDAINEFFTADKEKYADIYNSGYTMNFVSPIVAAQTVKNAIYSLLIAIAGIIIYVAWRFKWTFSISAIVALIHDALFTLAFFAIFRIEVNLEFISAILAIIGYSINDTIVEFDRIREIITESDKKQLTPSERKDICDEALQQTVSRSIMTTVSTLLTVIALLVFGSSSSINFNIAMLVGLTVGTFSSVFIATWFWLKIELLRDKLKIKQRERKARRPKVESGESQEYVFIGINDYK